MEKQRADLRCIGNALKGVFMKGKKLCSLFLVVVLVLGMLPTALAFAEEGKEPEERVQTEVQNADKEAADRSAEADAPQVSGTVETQSVEENGDKAAADTLAAGVIPDANFRKLINLSLKREETLPVTAADMEKLTNLDVDESVKDLEGIQYATNLTRLHIEGNAAGIENIHALKNLKSLSLLYNKLFRMDMLSNMPELHTLSVLGGGITTLDGLTPEKVPQLKALACSRCSALEDISALSNMAFKNLTSLDLEGENLITDISPLKGYTNLEDLDLEKVPINDENRAAYQETIRSLTGLGHLSMPYCQVTDADVEMFAPLQNLTYLVLNENKISNTKFCDQLPMSLTILGLNGNDISNMDNLSRLTNLRLLGMGDNYVTDFRFMKSFSQLGSDGPRHAEGTMEFPCIERVKMGAWDHPIEVEGTEYTFDNPYVGVDGNPVSFENMNVVVSGNKTCTGSYDPATNKITLHYGEEYLGSWSITLSAEYDIPVEGGRVKHCKLYIDLHTKPALGSYTVKFDKNSKDAVGEMAAQVIERNEIVPLNKNTFQWEDCRFDGWNTKPDGTGTFYPDGVNVKDIAPKDGEITLYAQWSVPVYYFYLDNNGSGGAVIPPSGEVPDPGPTEYVRVGTAYTARTIEHNSKKYIFHGWFTDQQFKEPYVDGTVLTGPISLSGKWTAVPSYTASFAFASSDADVALPAEVKDLLPAPQTVKEGDTVRVPEGLVLNDVKTADGIWHFTGWDQTEIENVSGDVTFTGTWQFSEFAEVLNEAPVISAADQTITVGDAFDARKDVTAKDREDGDLTDQIEVVRSTVDTSKSGVYEVTYKVTDADGASVTKTIQVTVKDKEIAPVTPSEPAKPADPPVDTPQTGDGSYAAVWMGLCMLSLGGLGLTVYNRKRRAAK